MSTAIHDHQPQRKRAATILQEPTMSNAMGDNRTPRWMMWTGRVFTFLVVAQLLSSAFFRATSHSSAVAEIVTSYGFPESAIGWIVAAECTLVVLYLIPQTSVIAALVLVAYLGGAVAAHLRVGDTARAAIPLLVGMMAWGGLYMRDARVRELIPFRRKG